MTHPYILAMQLGYKEITYYRPTSRNLITPRDYACNIIFVVSQMFTNPRDPRLDTLKIPQYWLDHIRASIEQLIEEQRVLGPGHLYNNYTLWTRDKFRSEYTVTLEACDAIINMCADGTRVRVVPNSTNEQMERGSITTIPAWPRFIETTVRIGDYTEERKYWVVDVAQYAYNHLRNHREVLARQERARQLAQQQPQRSVGPYQVPVCINERNNESGCSCVMQ